MKISSLKRAQKRQVEEECMKGWFEEGGCNLWIDVHRWS